MSKTDKFCVELCFPVPIRSFTYLVYMVCVTSKLKKSVCLTPTNTAATTTNTATITTNTNTKTTPTITLSPFRIFFQFVEVRMVATSRRIKCRLIYQNRLVIFRDNTGV